jgi:hypothetical protein
MQVVHANDEGDLPHLSIHYPPFYLTNCDILKSLDTTGHQATLPHEIIAHKPA